MVRTQKNVLEEAIREIEHQAGYVQNSLRESCPGAPEFVSGMEEAYKIALEILRDKAKQLEVEVQPTASRGQKIRWIEMTELHLVENAEGFHMYIRGESEESRYFKTWAKAETAAPHFERVLTDPKNGITKFFFRGQEMTVEEAFSQFR